MIGLWRACRWSQLSVFFLDSLIAGDSVLRERVLQVFRKDGTIYELRDYVERKREEEARHYQEEKIA